MFDEQFETFLIVTHATLNVDHFWVKISLLTNLIIISIGNTPISSPYTPFLKDNNYFVARKEEATYNHILHTM
jgi:hypothetical protein